jgi:hypothetical protein
LFEGEATKHFLHNYKAHKAAYDLIDHWFEYGFPIVDPARWMARMAYLKPAAHDAQWGFSC